MTEANKVVVRQTDGRVVRGTTLDFSPTRPTFHLKPLEGGDTLEFRFRSLKAVFFVKTFTGQPEREDIRGFIQGPAETMQGKKIAVRFKDGELLCGYTLSFTPDREGFFMFPADAGSNNARIFVLTAATVAVKAGPAAELLAHKILTETGGTDTATARPA